VREGRWGQERDTMALAKKKREGERERERKIETHKRERDERKRERRTGANLVGKSPLQPNSPTFQQQTLFSQALLLQRRLSKEGRLCKVMFRVLKTRVPF